MNPDLDLKVAKKVTDSVTSSIPKTKVKSGKFKAPKMNQFEACLLLDDKVSPIKISGPNGLVIIDSSEDSKGRELFVIVSDDELTVRRKAEDAVSIGLHLAGLSVGSQIEGAVHSVGAAGLKAVGKGGLILGNGLNAVASSMLKIGALLIK